jgi:hypothetical protein
MLVESDNNLVTDEHITAVTFSSCFSPAESTRYIDMAINLKPNEPSAFAMIPAHKDFQRRLQLVTAIRMVLQHFTCRIK